MPNVEVLNKTKKAPGIFGDRLGTPQLGFLKVRLLPVLAYSCTSGWPSRMDELRFLTPRERLEGVCPGRSGFTFERFCHPVCPSALRRQSTGKRYLGKCSSLVVSQQAPKAQRTVKTDCRASHKMCEAERL